MLGHHFGDELIDAGLGGLPIVWSADGEITGRERLAPEQDAALQAVIDAHDPAWRPAPTVADVKGERARRLAAGFDYDFGDARGVHRIGTTADDMAGWQEVTDYARALTAAGDTTTTIAIVTDTGPVDVTAAEWDAILLAAAQFRQPIWGASFEIMAMNPIPSDYAADSRWP